MKQLERILTKIDEIIESYEGGKYLGEERLLKAQRELSTNIYHLTKYNIEAFEKWNSIVYNFEGSNSAGQTKANELVPELRQTRKILDACKNVSISMTNELQSR